LLLGGLKGEMGKRHDDLGARYGELSGAREMGRHDEQVASKKRKSQWLYVSKLARKAGKDREL
jgi:hypothetical protein